ncbi:helix-turn-helix transcriptional regulator [Nocardiopsis sp. HNM0947]|uniref:Helix-turn-helix transcriptional regulator n=1 Tax=Nocardiopsis coralli TaxID=2772213 RepID=A0ABR9P8R1_9ACTN|nr:helix-turn-helix transcriptional regulator [Nocardiopsis coralli]MBE3000197.1 helix-turn-helix transcriptional regulator [Nocardiopsis coralli]
MGTIARRVQELRNRKGWSAAELGEKLTEKGVPWDRFTVRALEGGRRKNVTVQEFLALAVVLDVAPVHLLFPLHEGAYEITPNGSLFKTGAARHWFRGTEPYPRGDRQMYLSERPERELNWPGSIPESDWTEPPASSDEGETDAGR